MPRADWIDILDRECRRSSQKRAAERLGYSAAVVNQVLKGTYKGDLSAVEQAVRGALLDLKLNCPVCGDLPAQKCLEYQRLPFAATNPQRVQLYRACRSGCPHSRIEVKK
jgi:DNA-binding transcriptional regulator YdaS (Cro superfamily)